jgi:hypothetical protein
MVTRLPDPLCAQPSGYLIEYPARVLVKTTYTWLSGMSPVAAAFASPCRAFGEDSAVADVVGTAAVVVGAAVFEPPQPVTNRQAASKVKTRFTFST